MGGLWSVQNSSSLPLLPPHTFPLLQCGCFHRLQCEYQLCRGLFTGCRGVSTLAPEALLPPPNSLTLVLQGCFSHFISSVLTACTTFCPFLNVFSQRCHQCRWQTQLWLWWGHCGAGWDWLTPS